MVNRYKLKEKKAKTIKFKQVCLRCGKEKEYLHKLGILPRPNTTLQIRDGSRISCFLGSHQYYFEDEVEPND